MTREEAIKEISEIIFELGFEEGQESDKRANALNMAIKALKQELCKDAISREAVLNEFYDLENLYNRIKQLPPVRQQEPKTGHWIKKDGYSDCSECGSHIVTEWDYCPNCGARMESEDKK